MATDYQKPSKLYQLTSTVNVNISGASVIHGIYSAHNNVQTITFGDTYSLSIPANGFVEFPNPISATSLKLGASGSAMILFS